jgi:hypothetical protein
MVLEWPSYALVWFIHREIEVQLTAHGLFKENLFEAEIQLSGHGTQRGLDETGNSDDLT